MQSRKLIFNGVIVSSDLLLHSSSIKRLLLLITFLLVDIYVFAQPSKTLQASKNGHYLEWNDGMPVYINACTVWSLTSAYSKEDVITYLNSAVANKFNTIQVSAVFQDVYDGQDIIGAAFSDKGFSKPKDQYWRHVNWVVNEAAKRGLLVMINLIWRRQYVKTIQKNSIKNCYTYGRWFAKRFKNNPGVMYFIGGDADPSPVKDKLAAMAKGIQEVYNGKAIIAVHCEADSSSLECYHENPSWLTLNWAYAYSPAYRKKYPYQINLENYKKYPGKPIQFAEGYYDFGTAKIYNKYNVNGRWGNRYAVRRQAWWASFLSGSTGQAYGAEAIWHHNRDGETWQKALGYSSRKDMYYLMGFVQSIKWWTLKPDTAHSFLISGYGTYMKDDYALAAINQQRTLAVIYTPVTHTLQLKISLAMKPRFFMQWFDPTNGAYRQINKNEYKLEDNILTITSPKANSAGQQDWILQVGI